MDELEAERVVVDFIRGANECGIDDERIEYFIEAERAYIEGMRFNMNDYGL